MKNDKIDEKDCQNVTNIKSMNPKNNRKTKINVEIRNSEDYYESIIRRMINKNQRSSTFIVIHIGNNTKKRVDQSLAIYITRSMFCLSFLKDFSTF